MLCRYVPIESIGEVNSPPPQHYDARIRIQAQDDFARRLAQETKALLAVEHEKRVDKVSQPA